VLTTKQQIFHLAPTPSADGNAKWSINLVNVLSHGDPANLNSAPPITCILPMVGNVYSGDEEGRVVSAVVPFGVG
jgi:hypothetical protein